MDQKKELDQDQIISIVPFLRDLPQESAKKAAINLVNRLHPADRVIVLENDWGGAVYFILDGWLKIRTYNSGGKEVTLNIIGNGEIFGEMAVIDEIPRSTDVITLTETKVCSIPSQDFLHLLNTEPQAGIQLSRLIAKRLRQLNRRLCARESDSLARIVDTLLFLAQGQGKKEGDALIIPNLPHRELSSISGLARETVTRSLIKLEKKRLIKRELKNLIILDEQGLEKLIS